jgi:hypothetical protein
MTKTAFVEEWLKGKTRQDFELIEHDDGRILWPVKINRLRKGGQFEEEKAYLQVLDAGDLVDAKRAALNAFEEAGFKYDDPRTADIWLQFEMISRISIALRDKTPDSTGVHPQRHSFDTLLRYKETGISLAEIESLNRRLDVVTQLQDPRLGEMDTATVVFAAGKVAEIGNLSPLAAIVGSEVDIFVIKVCALLIACLTPEQLSQLVENSIKGVSQSKKSSGSSKVKPSKSPAPSSSPILAANDPLLTKPDGTNPA